ncbi:hypothetical protein Xoosp13_249 [Xanthomonas phage Xoo-sp13]|nr:hypothetical protein Xoosp13_249 [Xanthomonas phage Xoo-sp13]
MIRKIDIIEKLAENPLEDFLNIEPGTTEVIKYQRNTEIADYEEFDPKDKEIESSFQEIADAALSGYDNIQEMVDTADTKLVARLTEVSNQLLNTALAALSKKAQLKENKDRLIARKNAASKSTNSQTLLVMDRNDLLKQLRDAREAEEKNTIDVEVVEVKKDKE